LLFKVQIQKSRTRKYSCTA